MLIKEIKKGLQKDLVRQATTQSGVKSAQIQAVLANGQAQIKDATGRVSFAMAPQQDLELSQSVYVLGGYVVSNRGPYFLPALEEFEV